MSGLLQFSREQQLGSNPLSWARLEEDGLPYRGESPGLLREEEYEKLVAKSSYVKNKLFDTSNPESNAEYLAIMTKAAAGWFKIIYRDIWREEHVHYVYLEWVEHYMEKH